MKTLTLRPQLPTPRPWPWPSSRRSCSNHTPLFVKPIFKLQSKPHPPSTFPVISITQQYPTLHHHADRESSCQVMGPQNRNSRRILIIGAVSVGFLLLLTGLDDHKAWALGPEGPLVEEFWDNVRRYALYALTVSTGAIYTIVQPIFELLKNPISAILVIAIFGGSIYIVSQVLSAMVGVSDFNYEYGY